jgi:hypothetical protein
MVGKCASFAFGLALVVMLGFAMSHAHPLKDPSGSIGFSTPCQPASPAFQATGEPKVVSTIDSMFAAETAETLAGIGRGSRRNGLAGDAVSRARDLPPLLHRPPPANS